VAEPIVPLRELRNRTSEVLRRVESGEHLVVTVDRRPVAQLVPLPSTRAWLPASEVWDRIRSSQADPALAEELDELFDTRVGE
jgi:prevent-host-death family protein